jgi:putative phosphoesterase
MALIGLLSDTHVPHRLAALPAPLFERLAGVDLILHAGDLDDPIILDELGQIAPVQAVRGNRHLQSPWPNDQRLPLVLELEIEGQRIIVTHGHLSLWNNILDKFRLLIPGYYKRVNSHLIQRVSRAFPDADVYVFGHSHRALVERCNGALFVNPGAVCRSPWGAPSVAKLTVMPKRVEAEIVSISGQ